MYVYVYIYIYLVNIASSTFNISPHQLQDAFKIASSAFITPL